MLNFLMFNKDITLHQIFTIDIVYILTTEIIRLKL